MYYEDPEKRLIAAIIKSGIDEKDYHYLNGKSFQIHCQALGLDPTLMYDLVEVRLGDIPLSPEQW